MTPTPLGSWPRVPDAHTQATVTRALAASGIVLHGGPGIGLSTLAAHAVLDDARELGRPELIHVPAPDRLDAEAAEALAERVRSGNARLLVESHQPMRMPEPLVRLWREGTLSRHEVTGLTPDSVHDLLSRHLGGTVSQQAVLRMHRLTLGNPLYLRELTQSLLEQGGLVRDNGVWVWAVPLEIGPRLHDLMRADLALRTEAERDILDLLALAGSVPLAALATVTPDTALESLRIDGLVVQELAPDSGPAGARLAHPLHAEILRDLLLPGRRHALLTRLPLAAPRTDDPEAYSRWVEWQRDSGENPDSAILMDGARAARARQRPEAAVRLARAALEHPDAQGPRRVAARVLRAEMYAELGRNTEALAELEAAEGILAELPAESVSARAVEDERESVSISLVRMAWQYADLDHHGGAPLATALERFAAARTRIGENATRTTEIMLVVGRLRRLGVGGRHDLTVDPIRGLLAGPNGRHPGSVILVPSLVLGLAHRGALAEALELADATLETVDHTPSSYHWLRTDLVFARFWACMWLGEPKRAMEVFSASTHEGHHVDPGLEQVGMAHISAAFGSWTNALRSYQGGLSYLEVADPRGSLAMTWSGYALALLLSGDHAGAREARVRARESAARSSREVEGEIAYKLLLVGYGLGDPDLLRNIEDFVDYAQGHGFVVDHVRGLHLQILASGRASRAQLLPLLRAAAARMEGPLAALLLHHAEALVAGDAGRAADALTELNGAGVWLPAPSMRLALTRRQREIAGLAAAGETNAQIAQRLTLSVRTVDTHIAHIFTRLGVSRRTELAQALSAA
ncbi:LuxR family transcriptional regulator [Mycetocola tolaasinivorans]|uniref:LuxR family transcriptional regulator n=1 Tax=Mycetocola tolaasinivorans TaxID=76635 RepID=A0A3L7ACA3_9MICO|nr:helix-turn-helix transcriptional regulator [Mycetocola tolaasinivorans]RLP77281.1 LuxR family transcriptional regulator [Mycetocola tolaasinivorans]